MRKTALSLMVLACFSGMVEAANLDVVEVAAPAINCKFDTDCKITVSDMASKFFVSGLKGQGFLQSRTWPIGQPGTPGAKLYAYLYRVDATQWQADDSGAVVIPCVKELRLVFGPVAQVDYDGNGDKDQVFVITKGGLGSVKPATVVQNGSEITFTFFPPVCGHLIPGKGQTTYFIGLASAQPPRIVGAQIVHTVGSPNPFNLKATAPNIVLP